jgi:NAD-dependent dihydropyrimidine dehydrogenase PreA subunit
MTYIIAEPCVNTKERSCLEVCPVDCIYEYVEELGAFVVPDPSTGSGMDKTVVVRSKSAHTPGERISKELLRTTLFVHPEECIDCGACESVCSVGAIFAESDVPEKWKDYVDYQYWAFGLERK